MKALTALSLVMSKLHSKGDGKEPNITKSGASCEKVVAIQGPDVALRLPI